MAGTELKLICTDFDGTIHDERCEPPIAVEFEEAVLRHQAGGVKWLINTGRDLSSLLEELARSGCRARPDYLVVVEREIYVHERAQYVSHTDWNDRCDREHAQLFEALAEEIPKLFSWVNERYRRITAYEDPWSPFCLITDHVDQTEEIVAYLERWAGDWPELTIVRNDVYARLSHIDFNKGTALQEVAQLCDARPEHIFVAGDHFNDLPMFDRRLAHGMSTPANGMPAIQEIVRQNGGHISDKNSGAGIADSLQRWVENTEKSD